MLNHNVIASIHLENIAVKRPTRNGSTLEILKGISFTARKGEITAIAGPSGGGKSTLIRLINRLDEPTSGTIHLHGIDIASIDPLQLRRQVAMVLQKPYMFEGSVLANLQRPFLYQAESPPTADSAEISEILDIVRLDADLIERDARTLSLGEQQRVNLARALITHPRVLLLDEPTSALDRPTADRLAATLKDICRHRELAIILVSHDLRLIEHTADRLLYLEAGQILEDGAVVELLSNPVSTELQRFLSEPEAKGI